MNIVIKEYVEELFQNAPKDEATNGIKEEMTYHLNAKFEDLVRSGMSKEKAFLEVIAGVGNVQEIVENARSSGSVSTVYDEEDYEVKVIKKSPKKNELLGLISGTYWLIITAIYIIWSFGSIFLFRNGYTMSYSWVIFVFGAAGQLAITALYEYRQMMKISDGKTAHMGVRHGEEKILYHKRRIKQSISGLIWTLTTAIYIVVNFTCTYWGMGHIWSFSWVIFIFAAIVQNFVQILLKVGKKPVV